MIKRFARGRNGRNRTYHYRPQYRLILRLMNELGWTEQAVREQIYKERLYLLRQEWGEAAIGEGQV
ncbi:hypothetical protein IQ244_20265 [Nostoc sp. LEGE 06077]|uniref:hypothetical protein n=1 Tax=Nostoc sp. LEGE 06077 TaxID=915325 RepID=UPI001881B8F0|nr:hypothetical protein [Nostoc sp. LEGE 06077]MBE9208834.1 hypothetical protein [Nostoc sp. LEGE 06077]